MSFEHEVSPHQISMSKEYLQQLVEALTDVKQVEDTLKTLNRQGWLQKLDSSDPVPLWVAGKGALASNWRWVK